MYRFGRLEYFLFRESGDAILVLAAKLPFTFRITGSFFPDKSRTAFARNPLSKVVEFFVEDVADNTILLRHAHASAVSLRCGDKETAPHRVGRCILPAYSELFLKPIHSFQAFNRPQHIYRLRYCLTIPHSLDEVKQLANEGSDTTSSSNKYNGIERFHLSLHASVRPIQKCSIGLVGALGDCCLQYFPSEPAKGPKDQDHVP